MPEEQTAKKVSLPESHAYLLERIRLLEKQDPAFKHLAAVLADRLTLMLKKGGRYNRGRSGVMDHVYYRGDQSAYFHMKRYDTRLDAVTFDMQFYYPDEEILDLIEDPANYADMWLCCRRFKADHETESITG